MIGFEQLLQDDESATALHFIADRQNHRLDGRRKNEMSHSIRDQESFEKRQQFAKIVLEKDRKQRQVGAYCPNDLNFLKYPLIHMSIQMRKVI